MKAEPFGRVAVIHDWLTGMRGGEHILEGILDIVPDAEIFTLFHFPGSVSSKIEYSLSARRYGGGAAWPSSSL